MVVSATYMRKGKKKTVTKSSKVFAELEESQLNL